jgi:hypothetical protein
MNKHIVLSLVTAIMLLGGGFYIPAHAQTQSPASDLKPTFISPTPGLYVNGWLAFTVSYPKEWVEIPPFVSNFAAGLPRPDLPPGSYIPSLAISVFGNHLPLEDWTKIFMPVWAATATDIKVLTDKPSQLKDGTPAREVEWEGIRKNGLKINQFVLMTKKDFLWIPIHLTDNKGKIGEDLKKYAYSLTFLQGREEPVNVPADVRAFLDMFCADVVSHDVKTMMAHYSDRFRNSGMNKAFWEQVWRNEPDSPIQRGVTSCEATVTVFEPHGDKAYIDGFIMHKEKGDASSLTGPMMFQQIINENGQWKWYGNQK